MTSVSFRRAGARARGEARFQGGYEPILPQLNRLQVQHLTLEFTAPEAGDLAVLGKLREDLEVGLGCVSTQPGEVDSVDAIVGRVEQALRHVAPGRVTLNPDCGFWETPRWATRLKMAALVEGTRLVRTELAG